MDFNLPLPWFRLLEASSYFCLQHTAVLLADVRTKESLANRRCGRFLPANRRGRLRSRLQGDMISSDCFSPDALCRWYYFLARMRSMCVRLNKRCRELFNIERFIFDGGVAIGCRRRYHDHERGKRMSEMHGWRRWTRALWRRPLVPPANGKAGLDWWVYLKTSWQLKGAGVLEHYMLLRS